jgi:hypothetical protein
MQVDVDPHQPHWLLLAHAPHVDPAHAPVEGQLLVTQSHRPLHVPAVGPLDVPLMHCDDDSHQPHPDCDAQESHESALQGTPVEASSLVGLVGGPKVAEQPQSASAVDRT